MSLNLRHDSIFGCSDKGLDNKVLLDPLKEKLYLPPLLIDVNFQRFSTPYPEVA